MFGSGNRVTFDDVRQARTEKEASLDYSPLPRLTGRSFGMALLVSMGGLIFGYVVFLLFRLAHRGTRRVS
jgi:SP family sugar:H+ symporter-like MFS transporter